MRRYETVFVLRPDLGDAQIKETIKRFEGIVAASGGELIEADEWGFRELAYRLRGERRGYYVRFDYGGSGATTAEVERNLKLTDGVLRYLSVLVDHEVDAAKIRADNEARKRRVAEARAAAEAKAAAAAEQARAESAQSSGSDEEDGGVEAGPEDDGQQD